MSHTWILIADRSGARIFETAHGLSGLTRLRAISHPEGRLREGELNADRPGRVHDRMGDQRHGVAREESATEHLTVGFARELAAELRQARLDRQFEHLVLVAGPKMLGHLREALDDDTAARVTATLDKDLQEIPDAGLAAHLQAVLPG